MFLSITFFVFIPKDNELQETKKAHNRRLHRYKTLRENYAMVNEQLRTFEHEST